jgi:hypothetical protein
MTPGTEPSPEDSRHTPSIAFQQWWSSNIAWFLPALSVLIAAVVLGIQIGGIKFRLEGYPPKAGQSVVDRVL